MALEDLTLRKHIEGQRDREKQRIILCKLFADQGLEEIAKRGNLTGAKITGNCNDQ